MRRAIEAAPDFRRARAAGGQRRVRRQASRDTEMLSLPDRLKCGALATLIPGGAPAARAEETRTDLFKIVTVKDEIIIRLSADEFKALGGSDASAVARALAQRGRPVGVEIQCTPRPQRRNAAGADRKDGPARQFIVGGRRFSGVLPQGRLASQGATPSFGKACRLPPKRNPPDAIWRAWISGSLSSSQRRRPAEITSTKS